MKSFEALQKAYEKELELVEKHKKNAADIKQEMEVQRGKVSNRKINALNFTGQEYDRFLQLLDTNKKTVLEAVELVLETGKDIRLSGEAERSEETDE